MTKKIRFLSTGPRVDNVQAAVPAKKTIPQWYKDIPPEIPQIRSSMRNRSTAKKCVPFLDAFTSGYMLTFPQDMEIKHNPDGTKAAYWGFNFDDRAMLVPEQPHRMTGLVAPEGYHRLLWRAELATGIKTPKGYSTLVTHPFNRYDLPFLTLTGVIDTDRSLRGIVANIWLRDDFEGIIEKGTPIAQCLPFKREDWEMERTKFDPEESLAHEFEVMSTLNRSYMQNLWTKKNYN